MVFKEKQKFTQWWIWVFLIGLSGLALYGVIQQLIVGKDFGNQSMSDTGIVIFSLFIFAILFFFWYMTLITEITYDRIHMRFVPFVQKNIPWEEIASAHIVNYGFVGFGIRLGSKYGTVYNMRGNKGLAITLRNGKKFVIGTQKETELQNVLDKIQGAKNS